MTTAAVPGFVCKLCDFGSAALIPAGKVFSRRLLQSNIRHSSWRSTSTTSDAICGVWALFGRSWQHASEHPCHMSSWPDLQKGCSPPRDWLQAAAGKARMLADSLSFVDEDTESAIARGASGLSLHEQHLQNGLQPDQLLSIKVAAKSGPGIGHALCGRLGWHSGFGTGSSKQGICEARFFLQHHGVLAKCCPKPCCELRTCTINLN